jgi:hypothetical protein
MRPFQVQSLTHMILVIFHSVFHCADLDAATTKLASIVGDGPMPPFHIFPSAID